MITTLRHDHQKIYFCTTELVCQPHPGGAKPDMICNSWTIATGLLSQCGVAIISTSVCVVYALFAFVLCYIREMRACSCSEVDDYQAVPSGAINAMGNVTAVRYDGENIQESIRLRPTWHQWAIMGVGMFIGISRALGLLALSIADKSSPHNYQIVESVGMLFAWTLITTLLYVATTSARRIGLIIKMWWTFITLCSGYRMWVMARHFMAANCATTKFDFAFAILHVSICTVLSLTTIQMMFILYLMVVAFVGTCFNWESRVDTSMTAVFGGLGDYDVKAAGDINNNEASELEYEHRCPEDDAGLLSILTFWWMNGIMQKGFDHPLAESELMPPSQKERPHRLYNSFEKEWESQKLEYDTETPSLIRVLRRAFGRIFFEAGFLKWIYDSLQIISPLILSQITLYLQEGSTQPRINGWFFVAALFGIGILKTLVLHQYFHRMFRFGMRIRAAMVIAVYQKALRLSQFGRDRYSMGEIVTLMSTDAQRLQDVMPYFHVIWSGPYTIALCLYFLYQQVGVVNAVWLGCDDLHDPTQYVLQTK
eukprot:jgi/Bigna1/74417/fgenesh1_pg.29_\